mmetsp:Transcript_22251/g.35968  ORF Transcript_22251/g.35968 Transcript_22251/m.35968 type:complete len:199 (+) Transcript_22251:213-809(+)
MYKKSLTGKPNTDLRAGHPKVAPKLDQKRSSVSPRKHTRSSVPTGLGEASKREEWWDLLGAATTHPKTPKKIKSRGFPSRASPSASRRKQQSDGCHDNKTPYSGQSAADRQLPSLNNNSSRKLHPNEPGLRDKYFCKAEALMTDPRVSGLSKFLLKSCLEDVLGADSRFERQFKMRHVKNFVRRILEEIRQQREAEQR